MVILLITFINARPANKESMDKNTIAVFCTIFFSWIDLMTYAQCGYRSASTLSYKLSSLNEYLKLPTIIHKIISYKHSW